MSDDTGGLAEALAEEWPQDAEPSEAAAIVLRSDWFASTLAAARADAWDEGRAAGLRSRLTDSGEQRSNPYRAVGDTTEEGS